MRVITRKLIPLDQSNRSRPGTELDKSAARASVTLCVCVCVCVCVEGGGGVSRWPSWDTVSTVSVDAVIPAAATDLLGRSLVL